MYKPSILFLFILIYFQATGQTLIPYLKITGKYIFVDSATAKPVLDKEFDEAVEFKEGFAPVKLNGKYGYISKNGKQLADFKYDDAFVFVNGTARVFLNDKGGVIDTTGKEVISLKYDALWEFTDGLACVMIDEKWGAIDKTGREIIPIKYDRLDEFKEGLAVVESEGKFGYVNKTGTVVIPIEYEEAYDFSTGMAVTKINGKYKLIDKKGKDALTPKYKYHFMRAQNNGLFYVTIDSGSAGFRSGYIDKTGKVIVPVKYPAIKEFTKGVYLAKAGNKIQLISSTNKKLAEWDNYDSWGNIAEGIAFIKLKKDMAGGGKYAMINVEGKELTTTRFDEGGEFKNGIASVKSGGKWGFIDKTGKQFVPCKYDDTYSFKNGIARAKQNNQWFYIDRTGREYRELPKPLAASWLFYDDFIDNRNNWGIDSTSKDFQTVIRSSGFDLWNRKSDQSYFLPRRLKDFNEKNNYRIELTIQFTGVGPDNMGNGLIIGADEKFSNYYRFMINKNGQFRIDESIVGLIVPLQDWKESREIIKYGDNKIGFVHLNGQWTFYINEKNVFEYKAKELPGNGMGMFIGPGSNFYCKSFKIYDWTKAATDPSSPKEPIYDAQILDLFKTRYHDWDLTDDKDITASFTGEAFRIKNKFDGYYIPSLLFGEKDMTAFRVEMDTRHIAGVDDWGFGMCFGKKDVDNSWVFYITADGNFSVGRFENGDWTFAKEWTESPAIRKGNNVNNRLRLDNDKGRWKFYVNDTLVYDRYAARVYPGKNFGCIVRNKQTVDFTMFKFARIMYP